MTLRYISLFAGIGGFDLGFDNAGMECVAQVEIDSHARGVLARHWPGVLRLEDVREAGRHNLPDCDVICGGFPCQDLSVAGQRAGLVGDRSGLFYEMTRITDEIRPSFLVWENVPGLLSSDDGRDFARVLMELERIGYSGAWTTLDAQLFGVAQRRRRIFGVFARPDIGAGCCAEILSFAARMRWRTETGLEARARIAVEDGAGTARSGESVFGFSPRQSRIGEGRGIAPTLNAGGGGFGAPAVVAPRVSRQGKGAFTDPLNDNAIVTSIDTTQITSPGNYSTPRSNGPAHPLSATAHPSAIAFALRGRDAGVQVEASGYTGGADDNDARASHLIADTLNSGGGSGGFRTEPGAHLVRAGGVDVRRLTPRECERLQGFPDDWTRYDVDGIEQADSHRYTQLGNAVNVAVSKWLGRRIVGVMDSLR